MNNYTSISQSKAIANILPIESADMKWFIPADNEGEFVEEVTIIKYKCEYYSFEKVTDWDDTPYIPCWSLAALLSVLPKYELHNNGKTIQLDVNLETLTTEGNETLLDLVVNMIIHLHEINLL
jgi:hypothetical protein